MRASSTGCWRRRREDKEIHRTAAAPVMRARQGRRGDLSAALPHARLDRPVSGDRDDGRRRDAHDPDPQPERLRDGRGDRQDARLAAGQGPLPARPGIRLLRPQHGRRRGGRRRAPRRRGAGSPGAAAIHPRREHQWEPYGSAMVVKTRASRRREGQRARLEPRTLVDAARHASGRRSGQPACRRATSRSRSRCPCRAMAARRTTRPTAMPSRSTSSRPAGRHPFHHRDAAARVLDARASAPTPTSSRSNPSSTNWRTRRGADPLAYRLRFLKDRARPRRPDQGGRRSSAGTGSRRSRNRGRGIAFAQYKNYAALLRRRDGGRGQPANGRVRVIRVAAAADSGHIVSPDGIANQIEGGIIQSLSWTPQGGGQVRQTGCCRRTGRAIRSSPSGGAADRDRA